ncbi:MAG: hypothetical protein NVSMB46_05690 [Candidatus Saccharimonadales bacterium]
MSYNDSYSKLNKQQQQAVDLINGPLMVLAGPGTGKTQLLAMRVANILKTTDVLPQNILCLTFSESGEIAMRQRLIDLIGPEAYAIPVYTFHGFGSDITYRYPEYFYRGANFTPADDIKQYDILHSIFEKMDAKNPLFGYRENAYSQLKATEEKIKECKKAGYSADDIRTIVSHNEHFLDFIEPVLRSTIGGDSMTKKSVGILEQILIDTTSYSPPTLSVPFIEPLYEVFLTSLHTAITDSQQSETINTKPLTAWKNQWRDASFKGDWVFLHRKYHKKLLAVCDVYNEYQTLLQSALLYDYEDMIMQAVQTIENNVELQANLQEQYQYLLVDEYQDTNQAQLRLIRAIADHPIHEGKPNIMVVGDDDQAIYKFQGADINNMTEFERHYPERKLIVLTNNYRSKQELLDSAYAVITQGTQRLENRHKDISKRLTESNIHLEASVKLELSEHMYKNDQYAWVVNSVNALITSGMKASDIAVLGRWHKDLKEVVPFFVSKNIAIDYEQRENILESPHIQHLIRMLTLVSYIAQQNHKEADALMPEVLSYEFWDIPLDVVWSLSFAAARSDAPWLELMTEHSMQSVKNVAKLLLYCASISYSSPAEDVIDTLLGTPRQYYQGPQSPYYAYYFATISHPTQEHYYHIVGQLIRLRSKLREYKSKERFLVSDVLDFVKLYQERNISIVEPHLGGTDDGAVQLMTAHKAKGLEFGAVFILNALEETWGQPKRKHSKLIQYPQNLKILEPTGDTEDDWIRLFYVAMSRAKNSLIISSYAKNDDDQEQLGLHFIDHLKSTYPKSVKHYQESRQYRFGNQFIAWEQHHVNQLTSNQKILKNRLLSYKLSYSHLDTFLNVQYGGPQKFLLQKLLQFPSTPSENAIFGTAMHAVMSAAHTTFNTNGKYLPIDACIDVFNKSIQTHWLSEIQETRLKSKGVETISWLHNHFSSLLHPSQQTEKKVQSLSSKKDRIVLTGKIDAYEVHENTIKIIEYKTGAPKPTFSFSQVLKEAKMYQFQRQLIFYKLLIETSGNPEFSTKRIHSGEISFLEPQKNDDSFITLETEFNHDDVARTRKLIDIVWKHITELNFPDTSHYTKSLSGIRQFEEDLLSEKI